MGFCGCLQGLASRCVTRHSSLSPFDHKERSSTSCSSANCSAVLGVSPLVCLKIDQVESLQKQRSHLSLPLVNKNYLDYFTVNTTEKFTRAPTVCTRLFSPALTRAWEGGYCSRRLVKTLLTVETQHQKSNMVAFLPALPPVEF